MPRDLHLDTSRLAQIFKERLTNDDCPFCEQAEWELPLQSGATGVGLPWVRGTEYLQCGVPAVMLNCKHCGFIRLHSLSVLSDVIVEGGIAGDGPETSDE